MVRLKSYNIICSIILGVKSSGKTAGCDSFNGAATFKKHEAKSK